MKETLAIICNYNRKYDVEKLIISLAKQSERFFDVLVVDNNSSDNSVSYLKARFEDRVIFLQNTTNLGGSGGFNTGMKYALDHNYKYFALLDSDALLDKDCMKNLFRALLSNKTYGVVGAKVHIMEMPEKIMSFGSRINWEECFLEDVGRNEKDGDDFSNIIEVDYCPSCIILSRVEILKKVGLFDERYFLYFDDVDWCLRVSLDGWKIIAVPDATGYHRLKKVNSKPLNTLSRYYYTRNSIRFFSKYFCINHSIKHSANKLIYRKASYALLKGIFQGIYGSYIKNLPNIRLSFVEGFIDGITQKTGKAPDSFARLAEPTTYDKIKNILLSNLEKTIYFETGELTEKDLYLLYQFIKEFKENNEYANFVFISSRNQLLSNRPYLLIKLIKHIYDLDFSSLSCLEKNVLYADKYLNIISNSCDLDQFRFYQSSWKLFLSCFQDKLIEIMKSSAN